MSITGHNVYTSTVESSDSERYENELDRLRDEDGKRLGHRIGAEIVFEGEILQRIDPCDRDRIATEIHEAEAGIIERAIAASRAARPGWSALDPEERVQYMAKAREVIARRKPEIAALISFESGKPRADGLSEAQEGVALIDFYSEQVLAHDNYRLEMAPPSDQASARIRLQPYGVFGVIAPFNFPFGIPMTMAAAALIMGNTVVLKPSALTPRCGDLFGEIFAEAGLPEGVLSIVQGDARTGQALVASDVDGMAFTGSADVGLGILAKFAEPPYSRPVLAEMGGKSPTIVTSSADPEVAARAILPSAFALSAQRCNASSRVLVSSDLHDDFVEAMCAEAGARKIGDPRDPDSYAGPLINVPALERYRDAVAIAERDGEVRMGGGAADQGGLYPEMTVVTGLEQGHDLTRRELFVPILAVTGFDDFDDAIEEANSVRFGLAAGIFTQDPEEKQKFLDRIEAGILMINNPSGGTTGVWPGSQSMAGWKASGTSGKGGFGPYYLAQFGREQSYTEFS